MNTDKWLYSFGGALIIGFIIRKNKNTSTGQTISRLLIFFSICDLSLGNKVVSDHQSAQEKRNECTLIVSPILVPFQLYQSCHLSRKTCKLSPYILIC